MPGITYPCRTHTDTSQAFRSSALLVVLVGGVLVGVSFAPDGPDTGPEVAARVRRGMPVDDVVRIIGVPHGDYRLEADRTPCFVGFKFPQGTVRYRWTGYRGHIHVAASATPFGRHPLPSPADYSERVVNEVTWEPVEQHPFWWRLRSPAAVAVAVLAGTLLVAQVLRGRASRRADAAQPSWPSPA